MKTKLCSINFVIALKCIIALISKNHRTDLNANNKETQTKSRNINTFPSYDISCDIYIIDLSSSEHLYQLITCMVWNNHRPKNPQWATRCHKPGGQEHRYAMHHAFSVCHEVLMRSKANS